MLPRNQTVHAATFFILLEQRGRDSSSSSSSSTLSFLFLEAASGVSFHLATRSSIFLSCAFSFSFWLAMRDCCAETRLSRLASAELCSDMVCWFGKIYQTDLTEGNIVCNSTTNLFEPRNLPPDDAS